MIAKNDISTILVDLNAYFVEKIQNGDFTVLNPSNIDSEYQFVTLKVDGYVFRFVIHGEDVRPYEEYPIQLLISEATAKAIRQAHLDALKAELTQQLNEINAKLAALDQDAAA